MTNEFDRLRAANPATDDNYIHGDLAAVARRAVMPEARATARYAQGFRLKIASAAMAATILTLHHGGWSPVGPVTWKEPGKYGDT
jgi:hypothetical protein